MERIEESDRTDALSARTCSLVADRSVRLRTNGTVNPPDVCLDAAVLVSGLALRVANLENLPAKLEFDGNWSVLAGNRLFSWKAMLVESQHEEHQLGGEQ